MRRFRLGLILALLVAPLSLSAQSISEGKNGNAVKDYSTLAGCTDGTNQRAQKCSATGSPIVTVGTGATDLGKAEDGTPANGETGVEVFGIHRAAPTASATTAGKFGPAHINLANGAWYTEPLGSTARVCVAITPDTNAFGVGDIVGPAAGASGLLTFANAFKAVVLSGIVTSVEVTNTEIDGIAFGLTLFSADPTGSTVAANGPLTVVAADLQKVVGSYSVADGVAYATTELYQAQGIAKPVDGATTSLFGILRTTGAPTWAAAQTVNVCLTIVQD